MSTRRSRRAPGTASGGGSPGSATIVGTSTFLDQVPLPVNELQARFPVTEHLWLTRGDVVPCHRVRARRTMIRSGDPWAGLDDFHRTALDFITGIYEREAPRAMDGDPAVSRP